MKWFILLFIMSMFNPEESSHPVFLKHGHIIEKATEIKLSEVSATPVSSADQDPQKVYVQDYEVIREIVLEKDQKALQKTVLDKHNYIDQKKSCPLQAKYALKFTQGEQFITLIVSEDTCAKVIVFSSEADINHQYHDLKEDNTLNSALKESAKK
ncbi:MAG: hypothetical protein NW226_25170 [Microscillaceae bacterium]|nr:hypothetical protein [Microscillaceae bacterium]